MILSKPPKLLIQDLITKIGNPRDFENIKKDGGYPDKCLFNLLIS